MQTQQSASIPEVPPFKLEDLIALDGAHEFYPRLLTAHTTSWLRRSKNENGFKECIVRIGKKDFLIPSKFEQWVARRAGI